MITLDIIKANNSLKRYMLLGNEFIGTLGTIEHNLYHADITAQLCQKILQDLCYPERETELGAIAGYLHDVGNLVSRYGHGLSGAILSFYILLDLGMDPEEIAIIMGALGSHEEYSHGGCVNNIAAALILADKSHVHRSRVRKTDLALFTPRDRVNYAVTESQLLIDIEYRQVTLKIAIDNTVCSVMEYFEIFLTKMLMSRRAAEYLDCKFALVINDYKLM